MPPPPTDEELATISSPKNNLVAVESQTPEFSSAEPQTAESHPAENEESENFWRTHVDDTGRTFYFNKLTQKSQWNKPDELVSTCPLHNTKVNDLLALTPETVIEALFILNFIIAST